MTRVLLIDGGQSHCRIALARDGVIGRIESAPGLTRVGRRYDGLRALVAAHTVDVVAAGLTGYAGEELSLDAPRVVVTNDAVTAYLGALGDQPGAVIVAGTGAIALAAGDDGWARADGWGTLLGDNGGGYWIGRRALASAARAADGRPDGSHELLRRARARYGDGLIRGVYDAPDATAAIAAFTPDVAAAAYEGEETAAAIWQAAGHELARTVAAAIARAGAAAPGGPGPAHAGPAHAGPAHAGPAHAGPAHAGPASPGAVPAAPVVSWSGGLFAAGALILDPFRAELARLVPGVQVRAPLGDALAGAARLAEGTTRFASLVHGVAV